MLPFNHRNQAQNASGQGKPVNPNQPEKLIRFVSLVPRQVIDKFDVLDELMQARDFKVDFTEFKAASTKFQQHQGDSQDTKGLRSHFEIEEKINVNASYKVLRQLSWYIQKEIYNAFLIHLNKTNAITCTLPLIFNSIFQSKQQILVSGLSETYKTQLIAKPDLKFASVPRPIVQNKAAQTQIMERVSRIKNLQTMALTLHEFSGIPEELKMKLSALSSGSKIALSDEEAINIVLIYDLHTRYFPIYQTFQADITSRTVSVSALAGQFSDMTQGVDTDLLIDAFRDYLLDERSGNEGLRSQTNNQLFSYLYKTAQHIEENRLKIGDHPLSRAEMFSIMRSYFTLGRSQVDPGLWSQCLFFLKSDDIAVSYVANENTIETLADETTEILKLHHAASTQSLQEIHLVNNIHRFISGKKVLISTTDLSDLELGMIRSAVIPTLYQSHRIKPAQVESIRLFLGMNADFGNLINPIHTIARAYGFMVGRRLRENVQNFLKPGLKELLTRFGKNFFNIFYEMVVLEANLPISRNQFASWLELKSFFKNTTSLGYIKNDLETLYDSSLSPNILMESGESCFPVVYSQDAYKFDYDLAKNALVDLITEFENDNRGICQLLLKYFDKGEFNLRSQDFRSFVRKSKIFWVLREVVEQSCLGIKSRLADMAVNNKIILQVPMEFEPILLLENIFNIIIADRKFQIHLTPIPVLTDNELEGISRKFSKEFRLSLKRNVNKGSRELIRAKKILQKYQTVYFGFIKFVSISVLDRQLDSIVLKIRQKKNQTPNHIKFHFEPYEKLVIGNTKKLNLSKLLRIDVLSNVKMKHHSLGAMEINQAILYFRSVTHKLRGYRSTISQIQTLVRRFSGKIESDQNAQTYLKQISKFQEMLETPIDEFNDNVINLLSTLARKVLKTITLGMQSQGILSEIYHQWKQDNPSIEKKIDFYIPFLRIDKQPAENNIFPDIARARDVLLNIKRRKCLIFFPESRQDDQIRQVIEIGSFIKERRYDLAMYVEISGLNKPKIEDLSKVFYPGNFFRLDRLKPIVK